MDREFIAGLFGGVTGVLFSHPIDTLRIRYQLHPAVKFHVRKLYSGVVPPLIGVGLEKFLVFGNYELIKSYALWSGNYNNVVSGMLSGLACTTIVTPAERIKINLQTSSKQISWTPSSLYRGWSSTLIREIPGYGIYFGVYELLKKPDQNLGYSFLHGGLAGASAWAFIYPSDVIKTRMQTGERQKMSSCIKNIYAEGGIPKFYKGFWLTIARAFILHAGVFTGYEWSKHF